MAKRRSTIPTYRRKRPRSVVRRVVGWIIKIVLGLFLLSILWVLAYRFIDPPITINMIGDLIHGRGAHKEWMPIGDIDRDMVRASIAAEDSKFCSHHGFDVEAIENAMIRNASGGRIRGGSTISQQTAKNTFLWNGGGYPRKAAEAWFTFLIEHLWGKRRIMEVYLNLAETGVGTYGVNAGSQRYFGHDSSAMSPVEAARIAAIYPLPKKRGAIAPKGFTRRYGNTIAARIATVQSQGLDACIYRGAAAPEKKTPPPVAKQARPEPGQEYESSRPLPPIENVISEAPSAATKATAIEPQSPSTNEAARSSQEPAESNQP